MIIGLTSLLSVGKEIYNAFDGGTGGRSIEEYYPLVKQGKLLCPGPYNIATVAQALERNPEFVSEFDAIISTDRAWNSGNYGPLTTSTQKASAVVNWAHGGRDCVVVAGEDRYAPVIDRLLAADARKISEQQSLTSGVDAISKTLEDQGVSPLQLGLGAVTLFLLLRGS